MLSRLLRSNIHSPLKKPFVNLLIRRNMSLKSFEDHQKEISDLAKKYEFKVSAIKELKELNIIASDMYHSKSGAKYVHFACSDVSNTFCATFKTPAFDSSGLQHVLEHISLCGSSKYPCRDPFFNMLSRSVATFMNAMTYPEHTSYPFTTINEKDFYNLADIYVDAVLNPMLREMDFFQEGWRLENENLDDPSSEIILKGVVFNEMKGVYSSNDSILMYSFIKSLLPVSYAHENGGIPYEIPKLSYEKLKKYHQCYYHPSNSCFVTYGDIPLSKHLDFISNALKNYTLETTNSSIPEEKTWDAPRRVIDYAPYDPLLSDKNKQVCLTVGFKITSNNPYDHFVLSILSNLLVEGANAPFYESLIESNIGLDLSPLTGLCTDTKFRFFGVGLKGIREKDIEKVESIINDTLNDVSKNGFKDELVTGLINNMEIELKNISVKRGLDLTLLASSLWSHEFDVLNSLRIQHYLSKFKSEYASDKNILVEYLNKEIIQNNHKLVHILKPDSEYSAKFNSKLSEVLSSKLMSLTSDDKLKIFEQGVKLKEYQEKTKFSNVDQLPKIHLIDMSKDQRKYELNQLAVGNVPVQFTVQPTNGITYFNAFVKTNSIPYISKAYLPLFCHVITSLGAGLMNFKEFESKQRIYLGKMTAKLTINPHHTTIGKIEEGILFSSYCLNENLSQMFSLWRDVFTSPHLEDDKRLLSLILEKTEDLTSTVSDRAHKYAINSASSHITYCGQLLEKYSGISQISFIKQLAETQDMGIIIQHLKDIACVVLDSTNMRCAINTTQDNIDNSVVEITKLINNIPVMTEEAYQIEFAPKSFKKFIKMPFDVNFVAKVLPGISSNHHDFIGVYLLCAIVSDKYLHTQIREKGGAYGSGVKLENHMIQFYSYRDPNFKNTVNVFNSVLDWVKTYDFPDNVIEEAKVRILANFDHPVEPGRVGLQHFLRQTTHEMTQKIRDRVFSITKEEIVGMAEKYLSSSLEATVVIGPDTSSLTDDSTWTIEDVALD